jgi:hypothetical protein
VTNKVTNIYEKIINKHPLTLTKNLTFLTFLTKSNQIQQAINTEVEKRVHHIDLFSNQTLELFQNLADDF